ncbi:MAG: branched-chain amino acid transporter permease [Agathobacter sp.]
MMSANTVILIIVLTALITFGLRLAPFLLFGGKKEISPKIKYLGEKLPYTVMATLVVYCLKGIGPSDAVGSLITLGAVAVVVAVHLWKKNTILSIAVGTIFYMILVHIF